MINKLLQYFKEYDFSVDDFNFIVSKIETITVKKNTIIQYARAACNRMYFINEGLLRGYYISSDGDERTRWVYPAGRFATDYKAFINREPSSINIEALQDSTIAYLSFDDLQILYKKFPEFNKVSRVATEQLVIALIDELQMLQENHSPLIRYEIFLKNHALVADLIPQRMIADIINVSPVHLSRIKSAYAKSRYKIAGMYLLSILTFVN